MSDTAIIVIIGLFSVISSITAAFIGVYQGQRNRLRKLLYKTNMALTGAANYLSVAPNRLLDKNLFWTLKRLWQIQEELDQLGNELWRWKCGSFGKIHKEFEEQIDEAHSKADSVRREILSLKYVLETEVFKKLGL